MECCSVKEDEGVDVETLRRHLEIDGLVKITFEFQDRVIVIQNTAVEQ